MISCAATQCSRHQTPKLRFLTRYSGVYFQNRWYHKIACLQTDLAQQVEHLLLGYAFDRGRPHRLPLGLLLINRGVITSDNLREALNLQRAAGHGKLGHWLRQIVKLEEDQLAAALGHQWGCPVFPLDRHASPKVAVEAPPLPLLLSSRAVPAHTTMEGRQMHIAFSERVDHTLLYGIEEILGCQTHACVSTESAVNRVLEELSRRATGNEICFDTVRDPQEIAAAICSYARQLEGSQIKVVRAGSFLWAAIFSPGARRDVLFRVLSGPKETRKEGAGVRIKEFLADADIPQDGLLNAWVPQ